MEVVRFFSRVAQEELLVSASSIEATKGMILAMKKNIWRAVIEVGFIIFLFYANLLMGEYTKNSTLENKSLLVALRNVVTPANLAIAMIAAISGHLVFQFLRKKI